MSTAFQPNAFQPNSYQIGAAAGAPAATDTVPMLVMLGICPFSSFGTGTALMASPNSGGII